MTKRVAAILAIGPVATLSLRAGCEPVAPAGTEGERSVLADVEQFAVYFSGPFRSDLGCYDMVILDPDALGHEEIGLLRSVGALPVAYLNVGEAETYRWFYPQVERSWLLGINPDWEDHYYVDARQEGWQSLLLDGVIPRILTKGYEGLFLDMVDTALPGLFPETEPGMVELLRRIRGRYPELILLMNHGFFLAHRVPDAVDGVVAEGVFTHYDFDHDRYGRTEVDVQEARLRTIGSLKGDLGLEPFLIDYAGPDDEDLRAYARRRAGETGLRSFLSTIGLDTVPRPDGAPALASCLEDAELPPDPDPRP